MKMKRAFTNENEKMKQDSEMKTPINIDHVKKPLKVCETNPKKSLKWCGLAQKKKNVKVIFFFKEVF